MPTCSQKRKCKRRHCVQCTPRPCIDSHRIPCPDIFSPICQNPFIHSQIPYLNNAHGMASNKASCCQIDSEDDEEKTKIIQCPYTPSVSKDIQEPTSTHSCCVQNVESKDPKQENLLQGFKAHISVDIGNGVSCTSQEAVGCNAICVSKSLQSLSNQQTNKSIIGLPTLNKQRCPQSCTAKASKTRESPKLSVQNLIKRIDQNKTLSTESQNAETPCCAKAYTKIKSEPILQSKVITTSRPGFVANKYSDPIPQETPVQGMASGGCKHGISSIMPQIQEPVVKKESPCCVKAITNTRESKKCDCRYPPGFIHFTCTGNITGVCKCTTEFN